VRKLKQFPYVPKPPTNGCDGWGVLGPGEFAEGPWGLFDFDQRAVLPTYFRANSAYVTLTRVDLLGRV